MFDWVKKLLGSSNDAEVKKLQKTVNAVEALEDEYKALTDEQLRAKTDEFRVRLQNGETEDDILPEAFAAIREADARVLGMRPYRVQVMGGLVLHQGRIAEMKTGRGQNAGVHPARVPERTVRQGRARRDRQRLSGAPRQRVDGQSPPLHGG